MRLLRATVLAMCLLSSGGCTMAEWAMVGEEQLAEAVVASAPFNAPVSMSIDANHEDACEVITRKRLPAVWLDLVEAGLARMNTDGSSGCALVPSGRSARPGTQYPWVRVDGGAQWRVPVGAYGIDGTNEDRIIMTRSVMGTPSVSFPWTFRFFSKLEGIAGARAAVASWGQHGNAHAVFNRTTKGWRIASLSMKGT